LVWHGLMHAVDVVPTLCALAGIAPIEKPGLALDGVDISKALAANKTSPRSSVVLDVEKPGAGNWSKFGNGVVRMDVFDKEEGGGARMHAWKLHCTTTSSGFGARPGDWSNAEPHFNVTGSEPAIKFGAYQLFELMADPSERNDLCGGPAQHIPCSPPAPGCIESNCATRAGVPTAIFKQLLAMYAKERAQAVYPFTRGPPGHPGDGGTPGVWEPWLNSTALSSTE